MTQDSMQTSIPVAQQVWLEDEIDLREYIFVLIRYWKWIALVAVLAAVAAFAASTMLPKVYEASAKVVIIRSRTEVSFDPKIQTINEDQLAQRGYQDTLVALVNSNDVATTVFEQVKSLLPEGSRDVLTLAQKVEASNTGDVISITVSDADPTTAASIADAWAKAYVAYVNDLYGGRTGDLLVEVQSQAESARTEYQTAQTALEAFLASNNIDTLQREIAVKNTQLQSLRDRGSVAESAPIQLDTWRYNLLQKQIQAKYGHLSAIELWLTDAAALRNRVAGSTSNDGNRAGEALAFLLLQRKALANSVGLQEQLQISPADLSASAPTTEDVDAFIATLKEQRTALETEIETLSAELLSNDNNVSLAPESEALKTYIDNLTSGVSELKAQLESQQAKKRELQQARDLTWENYTTIQRKLAEVQLSNKITDTQMRMAAGAAVPDKPVSPKRLLNTAVAGALGLMLSVFAVFAWEYWQSNPETENENTETE